MFSSTYTYNPYLQLPSSAPYLFPPPHAPLLNHSHQDIFVHQNIHDPLLSVAAPYLPTGPSVYPEGMHNLGISNGATTIYGQDVDTVCGGVPNFPTGRPAKKDRHSKIYTAQGLRDRRVRLSIEISRKFFDLQDMLGYDKASKTLEWLLTKSRKAIKELARAKDKNFSGPSDYEGVPGTDEAASTEIPRGKEARAKARARARERTVEKIGTRKLRRCGAPECSNQLGTETANVPLDKFAAIGDRSPKHLATLAATENLMEESALIDWRLQAYSLISRDDSGKKNCFPDLQQNWDIQGNIARPSFCPITNF